MSKFTLELIDGIFNPTISKITERDSNFNTDGITLIMEETRYDALKSLCERSRLHAFEHLIFQLVAKIQEINVFHTSRYKRLHKPNTAENTLEKQILSLVKVIKSIKKEELTSSSKPVKLEVEYGPVSDKVTITDPFIIEWIFEVFQESFGGRGHWEEALLKVPYQLYGSARFIRHFKKDVCRDIHMFFKQIQAFDFGVKETTDDEMLIIAELLCLSNVDFDEYGHQSKFSNRADLYDIKKNVRNWVTRH